MNTCRLFFVGTLLVAVATGWSVFTADGCAPAPGKGVSVTIADESAIIIWHAASKTQHFIRRASFATEAADFGFLVPTPTQPELGEASDEAFDTLASVFKVPLAGPGKGVGGGAKNATPPVQVLDEKRVAGQDVVVLKATDADALAKWLADHGYDFSANLKDWVKPYIDAKWIITASKIAKDKQGAAVKNVTSSAVRMSFKTEKPFFPYSEPAEQGDKKATPPARLLRVFYISTGEAKGTLGDKGKPWPANIVYDAQISDQLASAVLHQLKLPSGDTVPTTWHLTIFEDTSSPRPGTDDVYFTSVGGK